MRHWRTRYPRQLEDSTPDRQPPAGRSRVPWSRSRALIACCALLPLAAGCVTKGRFDRVSTERDELEGTRARLERRVEQLEASNTGLLTERDQLLGEFEDQRITAKKLETDVRKLTHRETQLAQNLEQTSALLARREAEIAAMRGTYDALVEDLQDEVAAGQIEIERLSSSLNLNLSQGVLFGNASADVSPGGVGVLRKLATQLSGINYQVEIIGHTDNVPIGRSYPSNWELAGARASSVVRLLADAGVDPSRMSAVSRGEYAPIASNETAQGRASNRRIEIRLTPNTSASGPEDGMDGDATELEAVGAQPIAPGGPASGERTIPGDPSGHSPGS